MTGKNIALGIVALIIIAGGIYYVMTSQKGTQQAQTDSQQQTAAAATPQVQGQDVTVGTGKEAKPGDTISVLYVGALADGTVFDSSAAHKNEPLVFTLGSQGLIPGFQIGVNGMKEGGERKIAIPPELGYGDQDVKDAAGKVIIPANSTIIFDVKLVKVTPGTSTPATTSAK